MSSIGMVEQSDEQRAQFESEAVRIVEEAKKNGLVLRLLGSLSFQLHCPKYGSIQKQLGRAYTDIDYAGYASQSAQMTPLFTRLGYQEDGDVNVYFAGQRMIFNNQQSGLHVDIFFDKLNFCHEISWIGRLEVDDPTIPLAEMLLEKMQIVKINEKDIIDTIMLLLEHPLGDQDRETINIHRISKLCGQDWGLWRTVTMNMNKVKDLAVHYEQLSPSDQTRIQSQVDSALKMIEVEPKTMSWKLRARIGDRVKWYQEVDEVM